MGNTAKLQKLKEALYGPPDAAPCHVMKALRERQGLSQAALGKAAGVSGQLIGLIESGSRSMTPQVATKAALELGVDSDDLKVAHNLDVLRRSAEAGQVSPEQVVQVTQKFAEVNGDSQFWSDVMNALLEIHSVTLKAQAEHSDRDTSEREKSSGTVNAKLASRKARALNNALLQARDEKKRREEQLEEIEQGAPQRRAG